MRRLASTSRLPTVAIRARIPAMAASRSDLLAKPESARTTVETMASATGRSTPALSKS